MIPQEPPPPPAPPEPGGDYVDLPAAARVLWRRRWLGAAVWLAIGLACAAYALAAPPRYTATATLVVESHPPWLPEIGEQHLRSYWWWNYYLQTQHRVLSSRTLAHRALDRAGLWEHADFAPPGPRPPSRALRQRAAIDRFLQRLRVVWLPGTYVFSIAFTSEDAAAAANVVNALAEEHVARNLEIERRLSPAAIKPPPQQTGEAGAATELHAGGVRVLDTAEAPTVPTSPDRRLLLFLALAGGFAVAVIVVFMAEKLPDRTHG